MMSFLNLTIRNLKLYFRDYMAVLFSILSMLIIIGLTIFFLGDMYSESLVNVLSVLPGRDEQVDRANADIFILLWTGAGTLCINGVTVTLACYSKMIDDKATGRLNAIYTSPVSRGIITLSYAAYAWVASVIISTLTLILFEIVAVSKGMSWFSFATHAKILGLISVNSLVFAAVMYFIALLFKSTGAWSGFGTVVGTLVGFLGGIYVPLQSMAEPVQKIVKASPIIYGSSAFRELMTEEIIGEIFRDAPEAMTTGYSQAMGIGLTLFNKPVTFWQELLILLAVGIVFVILSILLNEKRRSSDR